MSKKKEKTVEPDSWVPVIKGAWVNTRIWGGDTDTIAENERIDYRMLAKEVIIGGEVDYEYIYQCDQVQRLTGFQVLEADDLEAPTRIRRPDGLIVKVGDLVQLFLCYHNNPDGSGSPWWKTRRVRAFELVPNVDILRFIDDNGGAIDLNLITAVLP